MAAPTSSGSTARGGLSRQHLLWLLAALLGAATVHAIITAVHDTTQRRAAGILVTQATAERVVFEARRRLEEASLVALAPAIRMTAVDVPMGQGRRVVDELAREYELAGLCRCRAMLPVTGFFRSDIGDGAVDVARPASWENGTPSATARVMTISASLASALADAASADAEIANAGGPLPVHLWTHAALGDHAAITAVSRRDDGGATSGVGLIADKAALIEWMFAPVTRAAASGDASRTLARVDSLSVRVRDASGAVVFGPFNDEHRFRVTVTPTGSLEGLVIDVALSPDQITAPLIAPVNARQLWHLLALLIGTVIVIVLAGTASRREVLLARARSDFVAGVSHELRMPLAQILLASETLALKRERNEADRLSLAASIVREARRLVALVENVLLFSRTGAVELRPQLEPVAVDALFDDVVDAVELAVSDAGHTIETAAESTLRVTGDRTLLRQALVNLVDNALKYGGPSQTIRITGEHAGSDRVRLIVTDEGRGVPHAERRKVFEPYERLSRDQSSERTGTGLGLAVVRQIVTACGGRVWLEEASGGGTRAVIELPIAPAPRPATTAVRA